MKNRDCSWLALAVAAIVFCHVPSEAFAFMDAFNDVIFGDLGIKDDEAEFRVFYNVRNVRDNGVKLLTDEKDLPALKSLSGFGMDLTMGARRAQIGLRVVYDRTQNDGATPHGPLPEGASPGPNFSRLQSFTAAPLVRFYPVDTEFVRLDFHASAGLQWSQVDLQKDGIEFYSGSGASWLAQFGGGLSFGRDSVFLTLETGYRFLRTPIDLGGPYFAIGVSFPD